MAAGVVLLIAVIVVIAFVVSRKRRSTRKSSRVLPKKLLDVPSYIPFFGKSTESKIKNIEADTEKERLKSEELNRLLQAKRALQREKGRNERLKAEIDSVDSAEGELDGLIPVGRSPKADKKK